MSSPPAAPASWPGAVRPGTPPVGIFIAYVVLVVIASVAAQVALAVLAPKEANAPADERERPVLQRAGNWSGLVLGAGAVT